MGSDKSATNDKQTTVLVTGASGQLGRTFQKHQDQYPEVEFMFCDAKTLDITKKESVFKAFQKFQPDFCINCAAYTRVEQAEKEPERAYLINAEGAKNMAEVASEFNTVLIHISTDYVFDGKKRTPYTTADATNPINIYGKSKLQGEKYIQGILKNYFIVRTSWLYSKEFGKNFYRTILEKAKTEKELYVVDNQTGCPTDAENLAMYILDLIITSPPKEELGEAYGIRHFSGQKVMTWYDFAVDILKENQIDHVKVVKDNSYKAIAKRPEYSVLEVL
ncbi:dTDP-4-dehydrorhamnose reductase [Galbibacter sp. EGI 63066]|uniref:dTDP-4-dehydrorhamnose reductase n=1 Tax=Galbibacter sp. EGI 63066 TaxID=2993559 RepID=UPI00224883EF|nr:dTDP-4-dehydrorhamnose reductase [Galbibacter sp. EGI 63066]MCX2679755.1 dTDP-4-dehydrorhamnose reductase [Galbibacter sp. EGI 63066]